jgi:hypothetical protein
MLATSRLILPDFVETMRLKLKCEDKDELIVTPFADNLVYATKSSSFLGCCMLGDFCDALAAERDVPEYLTSVPYCVHKIDSSTPVQALLVQGKAPVMWKFYPYWGRKPDVAVAYAEGKICFSVPGSEKQANEFMVELRSGKRPTIVAIVKPIADGQSLTGNCAGCFKFGFLKRCARCQQVSYCSRECQKAHWKLHKLQCNK